MTQRQYRGQERAGQGERERPPQQRRPRSGYRFLNPYNFVRTLGPADPDGAPLLGRCPPPPHDRYVGLTGRIECELIAETPLFIADSDGVRQDPDPQKSGHYHYEFFKYGGREAIPATSLRGVVRSVFEAATNSCFSVFIGPRLSYHLPPGSARNLVPARVERNDHGWHLRLLTGATPLNVGGPPQGPLYAAWVCRYDPRRGSRRRPIINLNGLKHGDECWAVLRSVQHHRRPFDFWNVEQVAADRSQLRPLQPGERLERGWLCITNQNIENKHDERFFFRTENNAVGPSTASLPDNVRREYDDLIQDYQERHRDAVKKRRHPERAERDEPAFSRFILDKSTRQLEDGDLVYAMLGQGHGGSIEVRFIVPVSVPRVAYERTVADLLWPATLRKCDAYDFLCPACRVFGWVWGTGAEDQQTPEPPTRIAYAGRVRFSYGRLQGEVKTLDDPEEGIPLAILSTPKPTTTRFYLVNEDRQPQGWTGGSYDRQGGREDEPAGYDGPNILRGRKVYRHHGAQLREREYKRAGGVQDDQNRTVHGVLQKGTKFTFTVHFENLAPVELGALLWALEMEDGWYHRLGMGKPFGFGSVRMKIKDAGTELMDPEARYTAWGSDGWSPLASEGVQSLVRQFKEAMANRYGAASFDELDNIHDLEALLTEPPDFPVHYPRSTQGPQEEGKNYEWFVGNKRGGRDHGPRIELPLPTGERQSGFDGLPLLDDRGDEV